MPAQATISLRLNGREVAVAPGTTVAAALWNHGLYHFRTSPTGDARGPLCGMGICFECRVTIDGQPHQRACLVPCAPGMCVETAAPAPPPTHTARPAVHPGHSSTGAADQTAAATDEMAPSSAAPGAAGGRSAGSGEARRGAGRRQAAMAAVELTADVAVVGAGPAGIAAACAAAEAGARVVLIDAGVRPGGQVWRSAISRQPPEPAAAAHRRRRLAASGATVLHETTVVDAAPGRLHAERAGQPLRIAAKRLVIATGARELWLPFPGWTLPNVVGVGGLQALLKCGADLRGRRVVVAGSGPLLLPVAASLARAGAHLVVVAEQAPAAAVARFAAGLLATPRRLLQAAIYRAAFAGVRYRTGVWVAAAHASPADPTGLTAPRPHSTAPSAPSNPTDLAAPRPHSTAPSAPSNPAHLADPPSYSTAPSAPSNPIGLADPAGAGDPSSPAETAEPPAATGELYEVTLTDGRRRWRERCDILACAHGLVPNLGLARLLGCAIDHPAAGGGRGAATGSADGGVRSDARQLGETGSRSRDGSRGVAGSMQGRRGADGGIPSDSGVAGCMHVRRGADGGIPSDGGVAGCMHVRRGADGGIPSDGGVAGCGRATVAAGALDGGASGPGDGGDAGDRGDGDVGGVGGLHGGAVELGSGIGGGVRVDASQRTSVDSVYCAGEAAGIGGLDLALASGEIAGLAAAGALADPRRARTLARRRERERRAAERMARAFAPRLEVLRLAAADSIICRCEDVRLGRLDPSWSPRQAKLYTRAGMGACQGRVCGAALAALYGWDAADSVRAPLEPVSLAVLAQLGTIDCAAAPAAAASAPTSGGD